MSSSNAAIEVKSGSEEAVGAAGTDRAAVVPIEGGLHALAAEAWEGAGEIEAAVAALVKRARSRPLRDELLRLGARHMIAVLLAGRRTAVLAQAAGINDTHARRLVRLSQADPSVYSLPLPMGKALGEATRDDLLAAAAFYEQRARTHARRAQMFGALAQKMEGHSATATVRDALDEATVRALLAPAAPETSE